MLPFDLTRAYSAPNGRQPSSVPNDASQQNAGDGADVLRPALPEVGPQGMQGAVLGHDGSVADLPDIGPHDFSTAQRVHDTQPMGATGAVVRITLTPDANATQYVVKRCPDPWHTTQTWLTSRLFGALGLPTPTTFLVRGCDEAFDGTLACGRVYLASAYLPTYEDIGLWLVGDEARRAIVGQSQDETRAKICDGAGVGARMSGKVLERLCKQAGVPFWALSPDLASLHADELKRRNDMLGLLCKMLPDVYQCELERHYIAALWLGNWDLCNVFMENVGVWRDKENLPRMMTVDFGACLDMGFQGTCKDTGYDVAVAQRADLPALPPLTSTFRRDAACFAMELPPEALADLTQFPYGEQYAPFVRRLTDFRLDAPESVATDELKNPTNVRAVAAEMAYRLSRIHSETLLPWASAAIEIAGAEMGSGALHGRVDAREQVHRLLTRRDSLSRLLGGAWAAQAWARLHPTRAAAIDAQQSPFMRR
ncbi:hypothetical protein ACPWR0_18295 [Pandoraea pneumonica]|uniref:hypothetical protein n=1 Tax=Pandoraea pneumonica TaxID=2508299 RepID=UPI003CEC9604